MNRLQKFLYMFLLSSATLLSFVCFSRPALSEDDLFHQFGGKEGLTQIAGDFVNIVLVDPRTEHFFAKSDLKNLKVKLFEQLCEAIGGPCKYTGRKMDEVHDGLGIKEADFNAVVEDLQSAMRKNHVSTRAQNQLLAKLAPMHRDIIEK